MREPPENDQPGILQQEEEKGRGEEVNAALGDERAGLLAVSWANPVLIEVVWHSSGRTG
jgi:hypothetical protein